MPAKTQCLVNSYTDTVRDFQMHHSSPSDSRTILWHFLLKALGSSRHIFAASTLAGLSSLGLLSMLMTDIKMVSGDCTGDHLSATDSYPYLSSSGGWRMEMHTSPDG